MIEKEEYKIKSDNNIIQVDEQTQIVEFTEGIVSIEDGGQIKLTTPPDMYQNCIYIRNERGKFVIEGGADLVSKIYGPGWDEKIETEERY